MTSSSAQQPDGLAGLRILVVEDEFAIALLLEDMLADFGSLVVGPADRPKKALDLIDAETIDLAILDVNVGGEPIYPVADALAARGIPFLFSTGYGGSGDGPHRDRPVLPKPFLQHDLKNKLLEALRGSAARA